MAETFTWEDFAAALAHEETEASLAETEYPHWKIVRAGLRLAASQQERPEPVAEQWCWQYPNGGWTSWAFNADDAPADAVKTMRRDLYASSPSPPTERSVLAEVGAMSDDEVRTWSGGWGEQQDADHLERLHSLLSPLSPPKVEARDLLIGLKNEADRADLEDAMRNILRRALKALATPASATERERSEWQPIETAPKDGTRLLGFGNWSHPENEAPVSFAAVMAWSAGRWTVSAMAFRATHWMPLPAPPVDHKGG